jgi:hypothetical protein
MQPGGGTGQAALVGDGPEVAQVVVVEGGHAIILLKRTKMFKH